MAPRREHAVATVFTTQVKSHDESTILVESGGFTPMRWFIETASQRETTVEGPPKKRRKLEVVEQIEDQAPPPESHPESREAIPLFEAVIDFHFPESIHSQNASENGIATDVDFAAGTEIQVVPYGFETDHAGTRLRLTSPVAKQPVLLMECAAVSRDVLDLLQCITPPGHLKAVTTGTRAKDHPASSVSCTLIRSEGQLYTVIRLQASLSWRSGTSAFHAGAPVGAAKVYPDYDLLLQAFSDMEREAFDHTKEWTPQDFYESVYVPPRDIDTEGLYNEILDSELLPFQKRAVMWMLAREGVKTQSALELPQRLDLRHPFQDLEGRYCFVNHLQGIVSHNHGEEERDLLRGGLLAEEMGLGKTVELLALISLHSRPKSSPSRVVDSFSGDSVMKSRATLIITPPSIIQQWQSELSRHAPTLSVHEYQGIPAGHKKGQKTEEQVVHELCTDYDVVITTYNTLGKEVFFAEDPPERSRRRERKFERRRSPMVQIQWWRICLDEAQMVESGVSAAARVAARLPRINSWAVSGTPLRKDVQDLHGLLVFLRYRPFSDNSKLWGHLITNHRHHFGKLFREIALRHTKAYIRDELKLPPQRRIVVTVPFTVIEQQNYSTLFKQMCEDIGLDMAGSPVNEEWDPEDPATVEAMRSWLIRLRQTCLHPQVGGKNRKALGRGSRPLRTVGEVLDVMIEQNETALRTEERASISASLLRAHIVGNNGQDDHRSERALEIYLAAVKATEHMLKEARQQLATARAEHAEDDSTETEEEDSPSESTSLLGPLRMNVRIVLQLHHVCVFHAATAYYRIKTNEALTPEGSDRFQELDAKETEFYDRAKLLRKEIMKSIAKKAEALVKQIKELMSSNSLTTLPKIKNLQLLGGIESRRIVEKGDELFDVMREAAENIETWRWTMAEFLVKPLVDEENEETTGDEYETSTKQQDEMYAYFDAIKCMHTDLQYAITGEGTKYFDKAMKDYVREAKNVLNPDRPDIIKRQVHAPETVLKLFEIRDQLRTRRGQISIRGLIQETRTLDTSLQWQEGHARAAEHAIVSQHLSALQSISSGYTKALADFEKEFDIFRDAQNLRVEYYRQMQEASDAVAPYKDELDENLDQSALEVAMDREEMANNAVAQLKTKNRFLLNLRDESGAQAEPKICIICRDAFERGVLTICGHQFCKECISEWFKQARSCPVCKRRLTGHDLHDISYKPREFKAQEEVQAVESSPSKGLATSASSSSPGKSSLYTDMDSRIMEELKAIDLPASYGTKIDTIGRHLHWIREHDTGAKSIIFSQYREFLDVLGGAFKEFKIGYARLGRSGAAEKFRNDPSIDCLLLDAKTDSSGLTLVNATHVFICEPLIQTAVELQAIARVHRIGQTRPTTVWMYLINDTVEEAIYEISVARRLAHVQQNQAKQEKRNGKSRASTPTPLQENAIDSANSEELQAASLTKLLVAGKGGGELVGKDDLWQCLFGKAQNIGASATAQQEVGRYLRAEAAEERRAAGASSSSSSS